MNGKVLCFAPYSNYHPLHGLWEMTILDGLRVRGVEVEYYLCDGLSECCDLFRLKPAEKNCDDCMRRSAELAASMLIEPRWIGAALTQEDHQLAEAFAAEQPVGAFFSACHGRFQIGRWIQSTVHTYFREAHLDQNDPDVAQCCRAFLRSGLLVALACERVIERFRPDALLVFNARMALVKVAAEVAALHGVPYFSHERGWLPERLSLNRDDMPMSRAYFDALWALWGRVPLTRAELTEINTVLRNRERGKDLNWLAYSPPPETSENLRRQLRISEGKRVWGLFTSSEDEVVSVPDYKPGAFASQLEWVMRTLMLLRTRPDIHLVIRVHPNTGSSKSTGTCRSTLLFFQALKARLPANATLVQPEDPVSTYDIMAAAEAGLVFISTCGLEMACRGKPVVCASEAYYGASGVAQTATDQQHYDTLLAQLAESPPPPSVEAMRLAHRFFYAAFFRADIPFPLVAMPDPYTGRLAYASLDELAPGRDASLDAVCAMIMDGAPVLRGPSAEHLARDDRDELEWFGAAAPSTQTATHGEGQDGFSTRPENA